MLNHSINSASWFTGEGHRMIYIKRRVPLKEGKDSKKVKSTAAEQGLPLGGLRRKQP